MNIRLKKTWVGALGVALALSTVGIASGRDADEWYTGGNATLPDDNKTAVGLRLYDAAGTEVTTGSTTAPLAAFAAADGTVRSGDDFASLFVHLPQASTAPGAWPGLQVSGTDKFTGAGAVTAPGAVSGKPFVRTSTGGYSLADVAAALPNTESSSSFVGVYELRLRTSSSADGVSDEYATTYLKVSGSTWTVTSAPVLGGGEDPQPVATSVAVAWPAKLTYGKPAGVSVAVTPASGSAKPTGTVELVSGATTIGSATLAGGTAVITVPTTALPPGSVTLLVRYLGASDAFAPSASATKTITIAKATPGKPTFAVTKKPSAKAAGAAVVTVPKAGGLPVPTGKVQVSIKKGSATKKVAGALKAGKATVKLPKLPAGTWTVTVTYQGDGAYLPATSKTFKLTTKA